MPTAKRSTATKRSAGKKTSAKAATASAETARAGQPAESGAPAADVATAAVSSSGVKRVLLVDDDAEIVESMRTVLESRGYEILVARDGNQGLAMAESEDPDLVVLDMMTPSISA